MWLDADYKYALVGHPNRKYLWILARDTQVDQNTLNALLEHAKKEGFDMGKLVLVEHNCP
jgi:apolipoprotein D and lipocalin family protein